MSMKLDVGEGERRGCDSWLRSELMPYSKGARYAHCTCMFWSLWTSSPSKTSECGLYAGCVGSLFHVGKTGEDQDEINRWGKEKSGLESLS